jgi:hypothetical protein
MRLFAPAKVETDTTSRFLTTGRRPRRGRVEGNRTAGKRIARISLILVAHAGARFLVAQNPTIERSWPLKHTASGNVRQPKGECTVKCFLLATAVACLLTSQTANAKGCLKGAALGGVAGHMAHHTFLGIFGGCAGGLYVHHLYTKWKKTHPNGSMNEFVSDNKDYLPKGWDEHLTSVGDTTNLKAGSAGGR